MDTFYCIKLITSDGNRGYVMDTPKGIMIVSDGLHCDISRFKTYQEAQEFMRNRKLERNGVKAYIRDNQDLMKEFKDQVVPLTEAWYIEDALGYKIFYDSGKDGYYLDNHDSGYCIWHDEKSCNEFIKAYDLTGVVAKKITQKPQVDARKN